MLRCLSPFWLILIVQSLSPTLQPHGLQDTRLPCPSLSPRVCSNSYALSWWCHPTISSSVIHFSFCLQSFPASGSFPISQLFISGGQSTRASASTSLLPINIQDGFPLGLTGLISFIALDILSSPLALYAICLLSKPKKNPVLLDSISPLNPKVCFLLISGNIHLDV